MDKENKLERKPISKKLRFDIFKRDNFQCVYCGKTPPEVTLEVDHIEPVSKGGDNDINNLVTSCFDCNRGKRNIRLTKKPNKTPENIAILKEQEEQLKEYRKLIRKIVGRVNSNINDIDNVYSEAYPGWGFSDSFKTGSLKRFLTLLSKEEIIEFLNIAIDRMGEDRDRVIPYFCGVCWTNIKSKTDPNYISFNLLKQYWVNQPRGAGYLPDRYLKHWMAIHTTDKIKEAMDEAKGIWAGKKLINLLGNINE